MTERRQQGRVERATRAELRHLGCSVQSFSMAAAAVSLAEQLDLAGEGRDAAAVAAQLRLIMADLAKGTVRPEKDAIDDVNAEPASLRLVSDR